MSSLRRVFFMPLAPTGLHPSRASRQRLIGIPRIKRNLLANPFGQLNLFVLRKKFHLREHQSRVPSPEHVHLPDLARKRNPEPVFLNHACRAQRVDHKAGMLHRHLMLKLPSPNPNPAGLACEKGTVPHQTQPKRARRGGWQIALLHLNRLVSTRKRTPILPGHQKLPLNLNCRIIRTCHEIGLGIPHPEWQASVYDRLAKNHSRHRNRHRQDPPRRPTHRLPARTPPRECRFRRARPQ